MNREAAQAIQHGLQFLSKADLLTSFSSPVSGSRQSTISHQTCFVPALILNCLADIPEAQTIRYDLCQFLLKQRSPQWSFNYWPVSAPERTELPYPDDLDDSMCALIALYHHDPSLISQATLAKVVGWLLVSETKVGGPYRTWLSKTVGWDDVDLAVNTNVAYFLSSVSNRLPNLDTYMIDHIDRGDFSSSYYPSAWAIYYYLARACPESHKIKLSRQIQHTLKSLRPNSLQIALALKALSQLPIDNKQLISLQRRLLHLQQADGSWPTEAFCLDPSRNGEKYYNGSSALTTSLALEALVGSRQTVDRTTRSSGQRTSDSSTTDALHQKIVARVRSYYNHLEPTVGRQAQQVLNRLLASDNQRQITLLPYLFAQSLNQPLLVEDSFYIHLGMANLYGWLAYTIYDDFLDEEGQPAQLSTANVALRQSLIEFQAALPNRLFQNQLLKTFDTIDEANAWEVSHCRDISLLPHYGKRSKLAERSLGHTLTPLAVLMASGYKPTDSAVKDILRAMRQYLITRQLDDDMHDWQVDASKNHLSYVVVGILKGLTPTDVPLSSLLPQMQQQFWHKTLPEVAVVMQTHLRHARQAITNNPLLKTSNVIQQLLDELDDSIQKTLSQQEQAVDFLKSYTETQRAKSKLLKTN